MFIYIFFHSNTYREIQALQFRLFDLPDLEILVALHDLGVPVVLHFQVRLVLLYHLERLMALLVLYRLWFRVYPRYTYKRRI